MSKHTPTPWKNSPYDDGSPILGKDGTRICDIDVLAEPGDDTAKEAQQERQAANACFIVRACNAHDELVAALRNIVAEQSCALGYAGQVMNMKACAQEALESLATAETPNG